MTTADDEHVVPAPKGRRGRWSPLAIVAIVAGAVVALLIGLVGLFIVATWWALRVPEARAEVEAATSEQLYQPIIADAELVDESEDGASRSLEESTPTRVQRTYVVVGPVVEAAEVYRSTAEADGWQLRSSECSDQRFVSSLTFNDEKNKDRGWSRVTFRPVFEDRQITDRVEVTVLIEVSGRRSGSTGIDESHSCLDDHVEVLEANPTLRVIGADEMLERITPELLIASGVGDSLNGHTSTDDQVWFNRTDGERLITVRSAEPHQIAALWGRQADEAFPFADDRFHYWFVPVDGGALIIRRSDRVDDEAMLELAEALKTG